MAPRASNDPALLHSVLERVTEVDDQTAPVDLRLLYGAIVDTFRVPFVGALFRRLGSDPQLLRSAWMALEGPLGTRYAEREADRIRTHALFVTPHPDLGADHRTDLCRRGLDEGDLVQVVRVNVAIHYALPKMLLAAAAGALALGGETVGGGRPLRADDARPVERGPAAAAVRPEPIELAAAPAGVRASLEELRRIHDFPLVPNYFRSLARWPAYLERVLVDLRPLVGTPRYRAAAATLANLAEVAVRGFPEPVRIEVGGVLRPEEAVALFAFFHERLLPDLILDVAFLRALLENERRARSNPLSLTGV